MLLCEHRSNKEQQKKEILKRLNSKSPKSESSEGVRPKWGGGDNNALGQLPLEETASNMEGMQSLNI